MTDEIVLIDKLELLHVMSVAIGATYTSLDDAVDRLRLKTVRQAEPRELSDEEIKTIFLAKGFTVKPGEPDLRPYVYSAARALIAAAREAKS